MATPAFRSLKSRYLSSASLQKIVSNMGWLFLDKALHIGVGLIVGVWVARYLGPERFGLLNYAVAFSIVFSALATLSIDNILVRELVARPQDRDALMGSAFFLKFASAGVMFPIIVGAMRLVRGDDPELLALVSLSSCGLILQSTQVISCYFQSKVLSKYTVYAVNAALFAAAVLRVLLVLLRAPVVAFGWAALAETALRAAFLFVAYRCQNLSARQWTLDRGLALALLRDGWPLILAGVATTLYLRVDQVMLGDLLNDREVGVYSVALVISENLYFVPVAVVGTLFPAIVQSRQLGESVYRRRIGKLYSLMAWSGIAIGTLFAFLSSWVIDLLYGASFADSAAILRIHIWTGIPVALNVAYHTVLAAENAQIVSFYATVMGAVVNIVFNWFLIPAHGAAGAAIATLISQCSVVLAALLFRRSRQTGKAMLMSFFFRW